jgi:class 3 adenylate cyclase
VNPPDSRFCNQCAAALVSGQAAAEAAAPPERAPRDYTPKHLADKILQSKSAPEGERKQVTVLFADVKGSMELAEQVDPEEWHRVMDRFFQILAEGVHRYEGTVDQYTGDGIMALFGAPIHTRITRSAGVMRRFDWAKSCAGARTSCGGRKASISP